MINIPTSSERIKKDLDFFREQFHMAHGKEHYQSLIDMKVEEAHQDKVNIIRAYKGVCQSMMAQFGVSPFRKMRHFRKGTRMLEKSIQTHPSVENIYLRLLLQLNSPKLLNYDQHIEHDITYLKEHLASADLPVRYKKRFIEALLESNRNDYDLETLKTIKVD